ncbi:phosphoglucan phosphatase lsf1 chloroplastic [Phtheirospermum japonicum]|uniref:Phosphoglucan phosphatase lsf1 chloroplastic n=1 Tax=Phtheirospermum japonicum TaxID=374723 RepID=A0A830D9W0_9LAMI|nr:phosphoglucan phosphatase lsf1 chloroplastic [Phtheirospermum japonicum]
MCSLQPSNCRCFDQSKLSVGFCSIERKLQKSNNVAFNSSIWGRGLELCGREARESRQRSIGRVSRVFAMSSTEFKMNLNEYMVTLDRPLGIRFALSLEGKIFVHALQKGGNAEKSRIIMVGDTLKKASESSGGRLIEMRDFGDTESFLKEQSGSCSLVLERPFSPFPIHKLFRINDLDILFNRGRVPVSTWNRNIQASNLRTSSESSGNSGFVVFCPKFLTSQGWAYLSDQNKNSQPQMVKTTPALPFSPLVAIFAEQVSQDAEWGHGSFPLEEYVKALERADGDLYYNHSLGMRYSKVCF